MELIKLIKLLMLVHVNSYSKVYPNHIYKPVIRMDTSIHYISIDVKITPLQFTLVDTTYFSPGDNYLIKSNLSFDDIQAILISILVHYVVLSYYIKRDPYE